MMMKKGNWTVPLTGAVVLMHLQKKKKKKSSYNKNNEATIKANKILAKILLLGPVE